MNSRAKRPLCAVNCFLGAANYLPAYSLPVKRGALTAHKTPLRFLYSMRFNRFPEKRLRGIYRRPFTPYIPPFLRAGIPPRPPSFKAFNRSLKRPGARTFTGRRHIITGSLMRYRFEFSLCWPSCGASVASPLSACMARKLSKAEAWSKSVRGPAGNHYGKRRNFRVASLSFARTAGGFPFCFAPLSKT